MAEEKATSLDKLVRGAGCLAASVVIGGISYWFKNVDSELANLIHPALEVLAYSTFLAGSVTVPYYGVKHLFGK